MYTHTHSHTLTHTCTICAWYLHPSSLVTHFQPTSNGQQAALWSRPLDAVCGRLSPEALQPGLPGSRKSFLKKICKKPKCLPEKKPANMVVNHGKPVVCFFLERKWPQKHKLWKYHFIHPFWIRILQDFSQLKFLTCNCCSSGASNSSSCRNSPKARPRRQVANSKAKIWYPLVPGTLGTLW